jgi:hypothetical protein
MRNVLWNKSENIAKYLHFFILSFSTIFIPYLSLFSLVYNEASVNKNMMYMYYYIIENLNMQFYLLSH